jgi:lysophospholipase L1-like esterase
MLNTKIFLLLLLGLSIFFISCGDEESAPLPSEIMEVPRLQGDFTLPADDTADSEIGSRQYPEAEFVIVAVGDSLTKGVGSSIGGYPAFLQAKLTQAGYNAIVINEGISGETSSEAAQRFLDVIVDADIVLLMIGINDFIVPANCVIPYACDPISQTEYMMDVALLSKITLLVSTVTPARSNGTVSKINSNIIAHNGMLSTLATEKEVVLVDNYSAILANGGNSLYSDKAVHFTDQGYEIIAQQWFDALIKNGLLVQ